MLSSEGWRSRSCHWGTNVHVSCPAAGKAGASSDTSRGRRGQQWGGRSGRRPAGRPGLHSGLLTASGVRGRRGERRSSVGSQWAPPPSGGAPRDGSPPGPTAAARVGSWPRCASGCRGHRAPDTHPRPASLATPAAAGKMGPRKTAATGRTATGPCWWDLESLLLARDLPRPPAASLWVGRKP